MSYTSFIDHYLFICDGSNLHPYISHTVNKYLNDSVKILNALVESDPQYSMQQLVEAVNSNEYIFTNVPNTKFSVSKMNPYSNTFYDFMEISNTLHLFLQYEEKDISSLHVGKNKNATIECMNFLREDKKDNNMTLEEIDFKTSSNTIEFIYYELEEAAYKDQNEYTLSMINMLCNLLFLQKTRGISVIKIADIYYKPILEILYLICIFYEKVYIIKPNVSNITTNEKYLVCKFFVGDLGKMIDCYQKLNHIQELYNQNKKENSTIQSFIKNEIPYNFICKVEEANIIIGQQQLEVYDQMIHIMKNKNREDRTELLRKNNIQKCIHWCEKYKIPHNKLNEKQGNIFLSIKPPDLVSEDIAQSIVDNIIDEITTEEFTMHTSIEEDDYDCLIESFISFPVLGITPNNSNVDLYDIDNM